MEKTKKESKGKPPKYAGEGIAIWVNKDKNNKTYLTVQLFGRHGIRVNCFKVEEKRNEL